MFVEFLKKELIPEMRLSGLFSGRIGGSSLGSVSRLSFLVLRPSQATFVCECLEWLPNVMHAQRALPSGNCERREMRYEKRRRHTSRKKE